MIDVGHPLGAPFRAAIAQPENMIEAVENHFVVGDYDDCGFLLDGNPASL